MSDQTTKAIDNVSWRKICEARQAIRDMQAAEDIAKENYKVAKSGTEAAQAGLNQLIDELAEPNLYSEGVGQ